MVKMKCMLTAGLLLLSASCMAQENRYSEKLATYYRQIDQAAPTQRETGKPVIGVSHSSTMKGTCTRSIELAGGIPFILPATTDVGLVDELLDRLDGIMFTGGEDINPDWYGAEHSPKLGKFNEKRDNFELMLFHRAVARKMPIFGVCRGLQMINVALGGSLYQDIPTEKPSEVNHGAYALGSGAAHSIGTIPGSLTAQLLGSTTYEVNSHHHQGILKLAPELRITAWSLPDSIPEAVEAYPERRIMAVQFHPELNAAEGDTTHLNFFKHLVGQAKLYAQEKKAATGKRTSTRAVRRKSRRK